MTVEQWIWYWGDESGVACDPKVFLDHTEMKIYSAYHSSGFKDMCKGYWSSYVRIEVSL